MKITQKQVDKWEAELRALSVTWRWGETRRFQSNARKIERRAWLLAHVAEGRAQLGAGLRCNKCHRPMAGTTAYDGACGCGGLIERAPTDNVDL